MDGSARTHEPWHLCNPDECRVLIEHINATTTSFLRRKQPVTAIDTKQKELAGDFKNGGREWRPRATPEDAVMHDFPGDALGKAIRYGVYDMARNEA